jgi:uncharacterized OB-fold protein
VSNLPSPHPAKHLQREMDDVTREFYRRLDEGELCATRCASCSRTSFPPRTRCPTCGGREGWVELPRRGRLFAFTTQDVALRFSAPAVLALAEIGEVLLPGVVGAPYEELQIGQEVEVALRAEQETGLTLLAFELVSTRAMDPFGV